jgi:hypothetical protein
LLTNGTSDKDEEAVADGMHSDRLP